MKYGVSMLPAALALGVKKLKVADRGGFRYFGGILLSGVPCFQRE